jgi:hypothetical protein
VYRILTGTAYIFPVMGLRKANHRPAINLGPEAQRPLYAVIFQKHLISETYINIFQRYEKLRKPKPMYT